MLTKSLFCYRDEEEILKMDQRINARTLLLAEREHSALIEHSCSMKQGEGDVDTHTHMSTLDERRLALTCCQTQSGGLESSRDGQRLLPRVTGREWYIKAQVAPVWILYFGITDSASSKYDQNKNFNRRMSSKQAKQMRHEDENIQMQKRTALKGKAIYQYKNTQEVDCFM
ncbi:hypothetical protein DPX16_13077 [Anabarilius grahami]|uniref:Uncharacterized protein n=1 Tax=Anabarilius grahami TaxID=495550 RepID=A0A3N0XEN3_ANAGA|nr:hypothetical protein DPX16_13077 [Anabarilius grahami]